ncbi:hypothetical protein HaLaN_09356 [Haematococcus lacustris]|uniref:Uncharacterized protein n=1 Tax=Haematococcus lacustris TaxID=44745 RepID=A0A699YTD0_HAELA|nr:hypothetical protein HaLaN_09356 [Haematococcus lacustris]
MQTVRITDNTAPALAKDEAAWRAGDGPGALLHEAGGGGSQRVPTVVGNPQAAGCVLWQRKHWHAGVSSAVNSPQPCERRLNRSEPTRPEG